MSNILFALYHDFSANSAVHVHNFANQLAALGHSTAVTIPEDKDSGSTLGTQNYSVHRFDQVMETVPRFSRRRRRDVHAGRSRMPPLLRESRRFAIARLCNQDNE